MEIYKHSEFEANFSEVENCKVIDNNGDETFIANEIDSYSYSDGQDSIILRQFDNNKTAYMDFNGCCYVSGISMSDEIELQLQDIVDNDGISAGNNFLFDEESLLEKCPEHTELINIVSEIFNISE